MRLDLYPNCLGCLNKTRKRSGHISAVCHDHRCFCPQAGYCEGHGDTVITLAVNVPTIQLTASNPDPVLLSLIVNAQRL